MLKQNLLQAIDIYQPTLVDVSRTLWSNPELAGHEQKSADLMRDALRKNGFKIVEVPGKAHAFYGEYGAGKPVIAILGEYDALAGLSQSATSSQREPLPGDGVGQGCGHNLLGSAALGAALALKDLLHSGVAGTIRFYGCPEEETLAGKTDMIAYGAFAGCDAALSWHPMTSNTPFTQAYLANMVLKFFFYGKTAHAAFSPHLGRSALDGVELMNVGANYLREHVIDKARIHYTTNSGGFPPNIVPDHADSWYYVRAPHMRDVVEIAERLKDVAQGAALMTGTTVEVKTISGCCEMLPNKAMETLTRHNMEQIALPAYTEEEERFAAALLENLPEEQLRRERQTYGFDPDNAPAMANDVTSYELAKAAFLAGSSDSGDVSYIMPMNLFTTACAPLGATAHTWLITACAGNGIGEKGMLYAAKVLAGVGYDLLTDPAALEAAVAEFKAVSNTNPYTPVRPG